VFRWSSEQWKQEAYLKPQAAGAFGLFGLDVSVSGGRLAVGAPGLNSRCTHSAPNGTGAIEIYAAVAGSWVFEQCLAARSRQGLVQFGIALALREDRLVVGAPWDASGRRDDPGDVSRRYAGAAYVFDRSAHGSWQERAYVKAPEIDFDDGFGLSVAISGERLAIGAAQESGGFSGTNANLSDNSARFAGAVYVFSFEGE
jgi:hypothetical protein